MYIGGTVHGEIRRPKCWNSVCPQSNKHLLTFFLGAYGRKPVTYQQLQFETSTQSGRNFPYSYYWKAVHFACPVGRCLSAGVHPVCYTRYQSGIYLGFIGKGNTTKLREGKRRADGEHGKSLTHCSLTHCVFMEHAAYVKEKH